MDKLAIFLALLGSRAHLQSTALFKSNYLDIASASRYNSPVFESYRAQFSTPHPALWLLQLIRCFWSTGHYWENIAAIAAAGSGCFTNDSPIRTAVAPADATVSRSAPLCNPDSLTTKIPRFCSRSPRSRRS